MDIFYCIIRRRLFQELNYLYILSPQKEKPKKNRPPKESGVYLRPNGKSNQSVILFYRKFV